MMYSLSNKVVDLFWWVRRKVSALKDVLIGR